MKRAYDYDLLILGGGAAGLTAAIYAVRYNLKTVVVSASFGGQILETGDIENWPGTPHITGPELSRAFEEHARSFGATLLNAFVKDIKRVEDGFEVQTDYPDAPSLAVKAVLLCAGAKHRKLEIKGESELAGRGVSYCATCDGPFFRNKVAAVVGGGDAAITGAIDLAHNASKVYLIHRRQELKAKPAYVDLARKNPKIEFILDTSVIEAKGTNKLESIILDKPFNGSSELKVDGLFIEIGFMPETSLARNLDIKFDEQGYVAVGNDQSTNIPGLFAAGDLTNAANRFSQLVTAAAQGAIATEAVFRYLQAR